VLRKERKERKEGRKEEKIGEMIGTVQEQWVVNLNSIMEKASLRKGHLGGGKEWAIWTSGKKLVGKASISTKILKKEHC
jgi:hypothetical protein